MITTAYLAVFLLVFAFLLVAMIQRRRALRKKRFVLIDYVLAIFVGYWVVLILTFTIDYFFTNPFIEVVLARLGSDVASGLATICLGLYLAGSSVESVVNIVAAREKKN